MSSQPWAINALMRKAPGFTHPSIGPFHEVAYLQQRNANKKCRGTINENTTVTSIAVIPPVAKFPKYKMAPSNHSVM